MNTPRTICLQLVMRPKSPPGKPFEDTAARLFIAVHSPEVHARLKSVLIETRKRLFSWKERSEIERKFIFGLGDFHQGNTTHGHLIVNDCKQVVPMPPDSPGC